jgi:hypothetical protein
MNTTLIISIWGATLSTLLGILTILDRIRSRPIIRTSARIGFRRNAEKKYATARFKNGPYGEISEEREIFVELRIENHGNKPMTMKAAYVEERNGE